MQNLYSHANTIMQDAIRAVLPESAVKNILEKLPLGNKVYVVSVGKAAWKMAETASVILKDRITCGIVLTKYDHSEGSLERFEILEAGHPVPDENSVKGTEKILSMVSGLGEEDEILFLLSGGGSALFEKPEEGLSLEDIQNVTRQCLACGADITEINTLRKRLSSVKGGKFAKLCAPAKIYEIVLSDVVGDRLDMIASGPACADSSTSEKALEIVGKYGLSFEEKILEALKKETPAEIHNVEPYITGSVSQFCKAAAASAEEIGYHTYILTDSLNCEAKDAGKFMAAIARSIVSGKNTLFQKPCAVIAGGETVVTLKGKGKGGRNQEIALSAALELEGLEDILLFSVSSDGTDGPTDAAGGIADGKTMERLRSEGMNGGEMLRQNDSYAALKAVNALVITGPTGTNVNDITVLLCR